MINDLRYADDTVILAEADHELQHLMDIVVQESEQKGLFLTPGAGIFWKCIRL